MDCIIGEKGAQDKGAQKTTLLIGALSYVQLCFVCINLFSSIVRIYRSLR